MGINGQGQVNAEVEAEVVGRCSACEPRASVGVTQTKREPKDPGENETFVRILSLATW